MNPERLLVAELPGYERGRQSFEVQRLICSDALACGLDRTAIETFADPRSATQHALVNAAAIVLGGMAVLLALTQRQEALDLVHGFIGDSGEGDG